MAEQRLPADERRRLIRQAALRVFARHGYRGATTRLIAAEAGVAEALIYRYFDSKQALFVAGVERTAGRLVDGLAEILAAHPDDPAGALDRAMGFARAMLERNEDLAKMVFIVSAELDDDALRAAYDRHQGRALGLLESAFRSWEAAGLVPRRIPPRAAAWLVLGTFQTIALMKQSGRLSELDVPSTVDLVSRFLSDTPATLGERPGS